MKKNILLPLSLLLLTLFTNCVNPIKETSGNAFLNVMTFNVRYDNPDDEQNNWKFRKERVVNAILFYGADIIGTQEVLHNQLKYLQEKLNNYNVVGVGRIDGKTKGEYSAIFYDKSKFAKLKSGYFWLSEKPEEVGKKGWDAACERIATWIILKEINSKKEFFVLNTHFDHIGEIARRESVKLILNKSNTLAKDMPIIVMGDFNAKPNSSVVKQITNKNNKKSLLNSRELSPIVYGPDFSFHDFGRIPFAERPLIDYIFVKNNIKVLKYGILAETDKDEFLSDHNPVFVKLQLN